MAKDKSLIHQAGVIPYRWVGQDLRVLLLTTRGTGRWLVPKGNIDRGLTAAEAAAKEAHEEAGVEGEVTSTFPLGIFTSSKALSDGRAVPISVEVYAFRVTKQRKKWDEKHQRQFAWVSPAEALALLKEPGLRMLIARLVEVVESEKPA